MRLHGLAGLPRSGTTLLGNVLAQHPDIHVSGTSALPACLEAVVNVLSEAPEVQSDLANVPGAYDRYLTAMRGLMDGWYADVWRERFSPEPVGVVATGEPVVIDKGRGWATHRVLLDQLYPGSIVIVCVRDPRDVIASIERQHRHTAAFHSRFGRTVYESADLVMRPDGMVGGPMRFSEDLIRRNLTGVEFVRYETFVRDPAATVARIAEAIGVAPFSFDFEGVTNQASDLDALYRNKFPHDGSGPIKPTGTSWHDVIDADLASKIAGAYPLYMHTFGYQQESR